MLDRVPPDAHTEAQPSPGQQVELRRLLGDEDGLALWEHQHAGGEVQPHGRGQEPVQDERLVEPVLVGVRARPVRPVRDVGAEHVIEDVEVRETVVLDDRGPSRRSGTGRCRSRAGARASRAGSPGLQHVAQVARGQLVALVPQHLDRSLQRHVAVVEHVAAVGDGERQLDVLLDEQDAAAGLVRRSRRSTRQQALDDRSGRARGSSRRPGAASGCRRAPGRGRASAARHPTAARPGGRAAARARGSSRAPSSRSACAGRAAEPEVLAHGEVGEQRAVLGHVGEAPRGRRASGAAWPSGRPSRTTCPAMTGSRPDRSSSVVVLPAPLGPSRATTSPGVDRAGRGRGRRRTPS